MKHLHKSAPRAAVSNMLFPLKCVCYGFVAVAFFSKKCERTTLQKTEQCLEIYKFTDSSFRGCATKEATGSIVFTALILRNETAEAFLFSVDLIPRRKGPREVSVSSSGEGGVKYSVT